MLRVITAELRKLRRPTLFFGTIGSVVGVTALVTSLLYLLIDRPGGNAERGTLISREALSAANGLTVGNNSYMFNVTWGAGSTYGSGVAVLSLYDNNGGLYGSLNFDL